MNLWEETVQALVAMHDGRQHEQLDVTNGDLVRFALGRARLDGCQQVCKDAKLRAVN